MAKNQSSILELFYLLLFVKCVFGYDTEFLKEIFTVQNDFNFTKAIIQSIPHNWTENHGCFIELDAIERGIRNFDEWAIKSM